MSRRAVLDTSVLVSGLLGGTATEVIRQWRSGAFELVVSQEILAEYETVLLRPRFKLPEWVVQELIGHIRERAQWVQPKGIADAAIRDASDVKFLEASIAGRAEWIVSNDKDLLDLTQFQGVVITSPWEFLSLLQQ